MNAVEQAGRTMAAGADVVKRHPDVATAMGVMTAFEVGGNLGKLTGDLSTLVAPVHVTFAPGVNADVKPASLDSHSGTYVHTYFAEVYLPSVHSGLRITPDTLDPNFKSHKALETYASLISKPDTALAAPIKKAFEAREVPFIMGGDILLPVIGLAALKMVRSRYRKRAARQAVANLQSIPAIADNPEAREQIGKLNDYHKPEKRPKVRRKPALALAAAALAAVGCGGTVEGCGAIQDAMKSDFPEKAVPLNLPDASGATVGATVRGRNAGLIVKEGRAVYGEINQGRNSWYRVDNKLSYKLDRFVHSRQYEQLTAGGNILVGVLSGSHCNQFFGDTVLPTVLTSTHPDITLVAGDSYAHNGQRPLEDNCIKDLSDTVTKTSPLVFIDGNHDPRLLASNAPGPNNNYSVTVRNKRWGEFTIVGAPDPRAHAAGESPPVVARDEYTGKELAFGQEGSIVARRACEIAAKTGLRPLVTVHYKTAGDETAWDGCASVVDNAHGDDNVWKATFQAYRAKNGDTVYQQTTTTASGYSGGFGFISAAERPGSYVLQSFDRATHELVGSAVVIYGPNPNDVEVRMQKLPKAGSATGLKKFLKANSPTYGK